MAVYENSRYINTPLCVPESKTAMLEIRSMYKFNSSNFSYHTFKQGDTLDKIANYYYGNSQLYWAILDANRQYQSELDVKVGDILNIPPLSEVLKYV